MCEQSSDALKAFHRVCRSAGRASCEYVMLQEHDRVLAALSGGVDSFVMLETLLYLQKRSPFKFEVMAATFDPGFAKFNLEGIAEYCRMRQVPHTVCKVNIPELLAADSADPDARFRRPCVRCSRLRRGMLYGLAREQQINKLALGHHASDLMQSFMISLLRGQGLTTMGPNVPADEKHDSESNLRIIRPLALVSEEWVKSAAKAFEFPAAGECPYKEALEASGDRSWAKKLLAQCAERIPDLDSLMLKSMGKVELPYLLDKRYLDNAK